MLTCPVPPREKIIGTEIAPSIGGVQGSLTFLSRERLIGQRIQNWKLKEASMKDMATALLASLFVLISLISLISADPAPKGTRWVTLSSLGDSSELELRYALRR
jgi:hypothetical protein